MRKFPSQGSNPHHNNDNARYPGCSSTRELLILPTLNISKLISKKFICVRELLLFIEKYLSVYFESSTSLLFIFFSLNSPTLFLVSPPLPPFLPFSLFPPPPSGNIEIMLDSKASDMCQALVLCNYTAIKLKISSIFK